MATIDHAKARVRALDVVAGEPGHPGRELEIAAAYLDLSNEKQRNNTRGLRRLIRNMRSSTTDRG